MYKERIVDLKEFEAAVKVGQSHKLDSPSVVARMSPKVVKWK